MKTKNFRFYFLPIILFLCCNNKVVNVSSNNFTYISGGRNVEITRYQHNTKNPSFPDKARFIGLLKGSWYEIGRQYGKEASEYILYVTDHFWSEFCRVKGYNNTIAAMKLYEQQITFLDPAQIDFINGIVEGAKNWLEKSQFNKKDNSYYASNYIRLLASGIWDDWLFTGPEPKKNNESIKGSCNSFAVRGKASTDKSTIVTHATHTPYDPLCYEVTLAIDPPEGNRIWTQVTPPYFSGLQIVNEKGVCLTHHFGGHTSFESMNYKGGPFIAEAYGVPWKNIFLYAGLHANTAEEAIKILTKGTEEYRKRTGRDSLLRSGGWNWLVADKDIIAVVEVSANRYAVRYPGDCLDKEWAKEKNAIVCANHFISGFSYDEHNKRTNVPMTIFNEVPNPNSEDRFWTLMWDIKYRYGKIDRYMAQHIISGNYIYNKETGKKINFGEISNESRIYPIFGEVFSSVQGQISPVGGTNDAGIAVINNKVEVSWVIGCPLHWEGAWDFFSFNKHINQNQ